MVASQKNGQKISITPRACNSAHDKASAFTAEIAA
jgi:hypothetical protein